MISKTLKFSFAAATLLVTKVVTTAVTPVKIASLITCAASACNTANAMLSAIAKHLYMVLPSHMGLAKVWQPVRIDVRHIDVQRNAAFGKLKTGRRIT